MRALNINFHHLYYFWVVAHEGGVTRAAERLGVAVQTISTQLGLLEQSLGKSLMSLQGRRLVLTEAGRSALTYADQIFLLGEQMQEALAQEELGRTLRLTVGISDALPKAVAYNVLQAALAMPGASQRLRLVCFEGQFESLLGDLALHKLDVLLTDRPYSGNASVRAFSHPLAEYEISLFGTAELAAKYSENFPACLQGAPLLLPTRNTALRARLDQWLEANKVKAEIVGEFEDGALMKTFGARGLGLFPGPAVVDSDPDVQQQIVSVGEMAGVREQCFAISNDRKIKHPAVEAILENGGNWLKAK
ncbi:MAG: transcriptional activator NhaR [Burkholderiales bacterium]|nr:transcriptional activator NhaR [Burkholderiales bacterium]